MVELLRNISQCRK